MSDLLLEVHNEHWTPMTVWVQWPGMRRFLGDAAPGRTTMFHIPADLARRHQTLQLHAEASGSIDEVDTRPIDVQDGRVIEWRLRKVLANSQARVR